MELVHCHVSSPWTTESYFHGKQFRCMVTKNKQICAHPHGSSLSSSDDKIDITQTRLDHSGHTDVDTIIPLSVIFVLLPFRPSLMWPTSSWSCDKPPPPASTLQGSSLTSYHCWHSTLPCSLIWAVNKLFLIISIISSRCLGLVPGLASCEIYTKRPNGPSSSACSL